MSKESESRHHGEYDSQESNHLETENTKKNKEQTIAPLLKGCEACTCENDLQNYRRNSVLAACSPRKATCTVVRKSHYKLKRFGISPQYGDNCCDTNSEQTKKHNTKIKKVKQKTDKQVTEITKEVAIKYLQKLRHFTTRISIKKTGAIKLTRNIFKLNKKVNVKGASATLVFISDRRACNFRSFASNTLSSSISLNEKIHTDEDVTDNKNQYVMLLNTNVPSKLMLKSKLDYFFNSQTSDKCLSKECNYYGNRPVVLNLSCHCQCDSCASQMAKGEMKTFQQSVQMSTISSTLTTSTETSSGKREQIQAPAKVHSPIIHEKPYKGKQALKHECSQSWAEYNKIFTQYMNKSTKAFSRQKFNRCHRCLMSKIRVYRNNFAQKYQTYFAELDYNNLVLKVSQASRQAVGIGSTCDFSIDFGRSTIPDFSVNGEPHGQINPSISTKHDHLAALSPSSKLKRQPYECSPGVCIPGKCEPKECFKRLKKAAPYGSHASTQSPKYELQEQREIRGKVHKRKSAGVINRTQDKNGTDRTERQRKTGRGLPVQGIPSRGLTRIGSKLSFNIQFYKDTPIDSGPGKQMKIKTQHPAEQQISERQGKRKWSSKQYDQGDTSIHHEVDTAKINAECEPGVCVPGKCDPKECYKRIKATHVGIRTDKSLTASSHGTSHSSQASTQSRKYKGQELTSGKQTLYKEKGVSSIPRQKQTLNIPNRQAVRIGSKCSFNIEFYKAMPYSHASNYGQNLQPQVRLNVNPETHIQPGNNEVTLVTSFTNLFSKHARKNKTALRPFECEPGVCIPGKCYPIDCYQRIKARQVTTGTDTSLAGSSNTTSHGSQASTKTRKGKGQGRNGEKATYFKEKGALTMPRPKNPLHIPNRQAVRIGSKCSFNIEFYKSMPHNGHIIQRNNQPAIALANIRNTESNKRQVKGNLYQGLNDQSDVWQNKGTRKNNKTIKQFECEPGVCIPGRCDPNECFLILKTRHEGNGTNANLSSSSNGASHGSQASNKMLKNRTRVIRTGKASFYKDKAAPSMRQPRLNLQDVYGPKEQVVRIGSKCSFNIEFYKSLPQGFPTYSEQYNQQVPILPNQLSTEITARQVKKNSLLREKYDQGDINTRYMSGAPGKKSKAFKDKTKLIKRSQHKYGQGDIFAQHKAGTRKKIKVNNLYECEPGVCIPDKCDPNECFARLKTRHEGTSTDASLAVSSNVTSYDSQASTQTKNRKKNDGRKRAGKETFYKDKAASTLPRSKMPLHVPNRQVVRIGSKCSFNVEFYKDMSKNGLIDPNGKRIVNSQFPGQYNKMSTPLKQLECEPGVCVPSRCDPNECYQRLTGNPWVQPPAEQQTSGPTGPLTTGSTGDRTAKGKKGKKQRISRPKGPQRMETGKDQQIGGPSEHLTTSSHSDQRSIGLKTASSTSSKDLQNKARKTTGTEKKSKEIKGNIKIKNQPPGKYEHGDAAVQHKDDTEKKNKKIKEKTRGNYDQGDATKQQKSDKRKRSKSRENPKLIKPSLEQDDKQFACDIGVCIPDKCDPNECFERLTSKHEGTSTDPSIANLSATSHGSNVATQSKIAGVNLGKKNKAGRERRAGKERFVKEKGTSSITTSNKISKKDIPQHIPSRHLPRNKQVVRIGSSCSFNIEFYKELPRTGSQINRELVTIAPKSEPSETQAKSKKGIVPFIKKCYCQISTKQKSVRNKETLMLYDQGSNTDDPMIVPAKKSTRTKPTLQNLECEPGACIYGKCDPNDCYRRLKPTHASLNTIRLQSTGPGKQKNTMRRFECRLGVCVPNKCDPNECFDRERSNLVDAGTDTSPKAKSTAIYGTNAATQSRRYPGLQQTIRREPFRSALCKCVAKIGPSTATTRIRQQTEQVLAAHRQNARNNGNFNMYLGPNMGYGDNLFGGRVKEKAVILGSGCSFNLKYFGKKKKKNRK